MSEPLFLILSGTYVGPELVSEFGQLPPCFLPNGTQRLFEDQIAFGRSLASELAIMLPDGFEAPPSDAAKLSANDIRVLRTDQAGTAGRSLSEALGSLRHDGRLFVLFGDTLVSYGDHLSEPDSFASGTTRHLARWASYADDDGRTVFSESVQADGESHDVVAGFFDFADGALLRDLAARHPDFIDLLNAYAEARSLRPVPTKRWLDFGHLHTYYWSRRTELTSRAFNKVVGDGLTICKTGTPARKIYAEASWFQNLPLRLRPFVPHFIDVHHEPQIGYELEYLHLPLLSELYTFANLPSRLWLNIVSSCKNFLEICQATRPKAFETTPDFPNRFFRDMFLGKTTARLRTFAESTDLLLDREWKLNGAATPTLLKTVENMIGLIRPSRADDICIWHGDFHFANIFFDFRSQRVRVVDPRGMLSDGTITMFGDARYDIAKLTHSVVGMYDFLIAGRYSLDYRGGYSIRLDFQPDAERDRFIGEYSSYRVGSYRCGDAETMAMVALLFLSMLPLHDNDRDRQFALLANGLRLAALAESLA